MQRAFVKALLATFVVFASFFTLEFLLEWHRLGHPGIARMSWVGINDAKLVDLLSPVARAYNNILAMLLATIGLAIPLTANMHTPKLISIFFADQINRVVLFTMAFGAANVLWVAYLVGPAFAPIWAIRFALALVLIGWAVLIPYFFYVVRFLDPSEIVIRLRKNAERTLARAVRPGTNYEQFQDAMHDSLSQIGTIVIKSLDRSDRGVAAEGVWAIKCITDVYGAIKRQLPDDSFQVDRRDFVGLAAEAIDLLNKEKTWFERKALSQLQITFRAALTKASDTVSIMSDATRVIIVAAHQRGDIEARSLGLRALNSYVRSALHAKNVHAIYDVFYQYRILARELREEADVLGFIAHAFTEYSAAARDSGLMFASHLATFDLGSITRRAFEAENPASTALLETLLGMQHRGPNGDCYLLVVKAKILLGAFFEERNAHSERMRVQENLHDVPKSLLQTAERALLSAQESYFELTDRQIDLEYVPAERRPHVSTFVARCGSPAL